jgi:hypothetical protein
VYPLVWLSCTHSAFWAFSNKSAIEFPRSFKAVNPPNPPPPPQFSYRLLHYSPATEDIFHVCFPLDTPYNKCSVPVLHPFLVSKSFMRCLWPCMSALFYMFFSLSLIFCSFQAGNFLLNVYFQNWLDYLCPVWFATAHLFELCSQG